MNRAFITRLALAVTSLLVTIASYGVEIKIITHNDNLPNYTKFIDGRDPLDINYYGGPGATRDVIETVLLQQQLQLGGLNAEIVIETSRSYKRILQLVAAGQFALPASTIWKIDVEHAGDQFYVSEAMVAGEDSVEGLYTHPDNHRALAVKNLKDLQALVAVSNPHWKPDWKLLNSMNLKALHAQTYWVNMVRMIHSHRADFIIAAFTRADDLRIETEGLVMVPIPNLRVNLDMDRNWAVGKAYPHSEKIFNALQKGQRIMREQGTIRRAYEECGFFDNRVKDWVMINDWFDEQAPDSKAPHPMKTAATP